MKAPAEQVSATEAQRDKVLAQYKTSDANIADFVTAKQDVEGYLEIVLIGLFALGSLLTGIGRVLEMRTAGVIQKE